MSQQVKNAANSIRWFKGLLVAVLLSANTASFGQMLTLQQTLGGSSDFLGFDADATHDGGWILTGYVCCDGFGEHDILVVKMDEFGNVKWAKTYGGVGNDEPRSIRQTFDDGFIIAGWTASFGSAPPDVYLLKINSKGDLQWSKTFGGSGADFGESVRQASDGGYVVAGSTGSFGAGSNDVYLIKTDSLGNLVWERAFGGAGSDAGYSVVEANDLGWVVVGETWSFGAGEADVYLLKTNQNGDYLWSRTFGDSEWDVALAIEKRSSGGFALLGTTEQSSGFLYLITTDDGGNFQWAKAYGGSGGDYGTSLLETDNGDFMLVGDTFSFANLEESYLVKTDSTGKLQGSWALSPGNFQNSLNQVLARPGGGFALSGTTRDLPGRYDFHFVLTDDSGETTCHQRDVVSLEITLLPTVTAPPTAWVVPMGSPGAPTPSEDDRTVPKQVLCSAPCQPPGPPAFDPYGSTLTNSALQDATDSCRSHSGDFNGDGATDLLRSCNTPNFNYLWHGDLGGAGFTGQGSVMTGSQLQNSADTCRLHRGDFDGNGATDLLRSCDDSNYNYLWHGNLGGTGFTGQGYVLTSSQLQNSADTCRVHPNDFNGDGATDLLRSCDDPTYNYLWHGNLSGTGFTAQGSILTSSQLQNSADTCRVHPGDFNDDGATDLLRSCDDPTYNYLWHGYLGGIGFIDQGYLFTGTQLQNQAGTCRAHVADFDHDGRDDVFRTCDDPCLNLMLRGASTGLLEHGYVIQASVLQYADASCVLRIGDFNGDGPADAFRTCNDPTDNSLWLGIP